MADGASRRAALPAVRLYVVTDASPAVGHLEDFVRRIAGAGAGMVQLRERALADGALLSVARRFVAACADAGALSIVNDRADIALAAGADGVHVGQDDLGVDDVRSVVGPDLIVGLSTHAPAEIDGANGSTADYIGVGPVFATPTKPGRAAVGFTLVRYASANARKPFFAIGGIDASNAAAVRDAGARAVSVVRAVTESDDPAGAVRRILAALDVHKRM